MVNILLFKKDYKLEFEKRCRSKIEQKIARTKEKRGLERAKIEENIRKSVCNCIAPHVNKDLDVVWNAMSQVKKVTIEAVREVTKYEDKVGTIVAPIPKEIFHERCLRQMGDYSGNKWEKVQEVGLPICRCVTDNVLPVVGTNVPVFMISMYDAKHSLRDEKTIKKFEEKILLEAMRKRKI